MRKIGGNKSDENFSEFMKSNVQQRDYINNFIHSETYSGTCQTSTMKPSGKIVKWSLSIHNIRWLLVYTAFQWV